jgi:hypothetical protein
LTYSQCVTAEIQKSKMKRAAGKQICPNDLLMALKVKIQQAEQTQSELNALLLALTGSGGTSELDEDQVCSLLCVGQRLCSDVLQFLRTASI